MKGNRPEGANLQPETEVLGWLPAAVPEFVVAPEVEVREEIAVPEQGKSFAIFKARLIIEALQKSKLFDELGRVATEEPEKEALESVTEAIFDYDILSDGFIGIDFATKNQRNKRGNTEIPSLVYYKDAKSTPLEESVLEKQKLEAPGVYELSALEILNGFTDALLKTEDISKSEKDLVLELAEKTFGKDAKLQMKLEETGKSAAFVGHTALQMPVEVAPEKRSDWSIPRTRYVHYYGPVLKSTEVGLVKGGVG